MKITKARASSGDTLVLIFLALASFPVAAIAFDQPIPYYQRGAEYTCVFRADTPQPQHTYC